MLSFVTEKAWSFMGASIAHPRAAIQTGGSAGQTGKRLVAYGRRNMSEPYRERLPRDDDGGGDMIAVAAYATVVEAEMSREYLKAHGVKAFTHESASFNPLVNVTAGGVRLVVPEADEARARYFLDRAARTPANQPDDGEEGEVRCPRCELTYCFHENALSGGIGKSVSLSPILTLLALPLGLTRKRWRCHKCLHVWDDPNEGPARATPSEPDDPRPVFRLRRRRGGTGLFVGALLGLALVALASSLRAPFEVGMALLLATVGLAFAGYKIGRRVFTDVCSAPHCRALLRAGDEECTSCHGAIAGVIDHAHEHYSEAAQFRRDLAALAEGERKKKARKLAKGGAKKRAPRLDKE
jgi:hypothetical protein